MDSLIGSFDSQAVLVIAAIAIAFLLSALVIRILKASFGLILMILAIVLVLQYGFGIGPDQLWGEIGQLPQVIAQWATQVDVSSLTSMFSS
jgi:glucan phosphoethanolaminetransferase (alkaline phosphatase superfamily)